MKKLLLLILTSVVFFIACNKSNSGEEFFDSNGVITGRDLTKCACCWGWIIEINNTRYKFEKIPASSGIDLENIPYPLPVRIQWRDVQGSCSGRLIEVISISR